MFQNLTCLSIREIMFKPFDDSLRGTLVELHTTKLKRVIIFTSLSWVADGLFPRLIITYGRD